MTPIVFYRQPNGEYLAIAPEVKSLYQLYNDEYNWHVSDTFWLQDWMLVDFLTRAIKAGFEIHFKDGPVDDSGVNRDIKDVSLPTESLSL